MLGHVERRECNLKHLRIDERLEDLKEGQELQGRKLGKIGLMGATTMISVVGILLELVLDK